jgi:ankyrin repeat protein
MTDSALLRTLFTACLYMLTYTISVQAQDFRLADAAKADDLAALNSLLGQVDVNVAHPDGSTALAWTAYHDNDQAVDLLINAGADPDLANDYGVTPLWLACNNRNTGIAEKLLNAGADPNAQTWTGETVLMTCSRTGLMVAVTAMLAKGAEVNAAEHRRGQTALMWAISQGHPMVARRLIEAGANVHVKSHFLNGLSPKVYLTHDGELQVSPEGGFTPLLFAAQQGDLDSARLLIEAGADVDYATEEHGNALLLASANGHEDLALYLLDKGADPNIAAGDGSHITPLHYALREGFRALLEGKDAGLFSAIVVDEQKSLTKKNDKYNPLPGRNMYTLMEELLARGANPNAEMLRLPARFRKGGNAYVSVKGVTPFLLAAASSNIEAMQFIVEMGGKPDVSSKVDIEANPTGVHKDQAQFQGSVTPLLAAAGLGRFRGRQAEEAERALQTVKMLIEMGADVNQVNETGWTPLHAATYIGSESIIKYLVEEGADPNVQNGCGQTPLSLADASLGRGLVVIPRVRQNLVGLLTQLGAGSSPAHGPVGRCVEGRYGIDFFVERDITSKDN